MGGGKTMLKLLLQSIPLKICLSILLIETLFLAVIGVFYTSRFNKEIDKAVTDKLLFPAVLMSERALNYSAAIEPDISVKLKSVSRFLMIRSSESPTD